MSDKSLKWRDRASHLRHTADNERNPEQKAKLLDLAQQWESLAVQAEELEERQRVTLKPFAPLTPKPREDRPPPTKKLG